MSESNGHPHPPVSLPGRLRHAAKALMGELGLPAKAYAAVQAPALLMDAADAIERLEVPPLAEVKVHEQTRKYEELHCMTCGCEWTSHPDTCPRHLFARKVGKGVDRD
jgi:hypothetical protein